MIRGPLLSFLLWSALAIAATGPAAAAELRGEPKVIDGDTIEVSGTTVRLVGVDAPELGQTCELKRRLYDCGAIARTALLDLTAGVTVVCRTLPQGAAPAGSEGLPGRYFADGYDLSKGMAYTGWALADRAASGRYVPLEEAARAARRGLWKGRFVAPRE